MRKFICVVLIVLLVCMPVCAFAQDFESAADLAPTGSAIQFDALAQDDGGVMPLAASDYFSSARMRSCEYNFDTSNYVSYGNWLDLNYSISSANLGYTVDAVNRTFLTTSPYYGFNLNFTGMKRANKGGSWSMRLNGFFTEFGMVSPYFNILYFRFNFANVSPVRAVAFCDWSGTGKYTSSSGATSWRSVSGQTILPVTVTPSDYNWRVRYEGNTSHYFIGNLSLDINFELPDTWIDSDNDVYEVTSAHVDSMNVYFVYEIKPTVLYRYDQQFAPDLYGYYFTSELSTYRFHPMFAYANGLPVLSISSSSGGFSANNGLSAGVGTINQSIGSLSQSITKQINEVKSTIQQGANEVKNSIDNQTQTLTGKLMSVKDDIVGGITDLKDTVTEGFGDVVQGITDLPGKIGEMLQGLIVPDSEKVSGKFEEFNDLAEEKLGVIYQVPEMVISMAQSIVSGTVEQKGEMTLPKFEIIMPATTQSRSGETLTVWEEYTFPIWPEGTEVIHTAVQTATSMICVLAMINSLKRKYEDWLDGK